MEDHAASRTAVLVCQGRAAAQGRTAVARFDDPTAAAFLRPSELEIVEAVRAGAAPKPARERIPYELVAGCAEVMVPRTVAIDDAIRERPVPQLVVLGAGLDGRPWRMPELAQVGTFEVDHPATQRDLRERVGDRPPVGDVHYVPVDFGRDRLDDALKAAGYDPAVPTTWIWEGVVPYLRRTEIAATAAAVGRLSAPGSRLALSYQAPAASASIGRAVLRAASRFGAGDDPWSREPHRSTFRPPAVARLLGRQGYTVRRDDDLLTLATGLGAGTGHKGSLRTGRIAIADKGAA